MKNILKQINKKVKKFDISPFSNGGYIKLLLYLIWGINAAVFICHDKQAEKNYDSEQLNIFEYKTQNNEVLTDAEIIDSDTSLSFYLICPINIPDLKAIESFKLSSLSDRAPPYNS